MQEYVNTHDQWYAPKAQPPCRWLGTHFDHECHGGIITDIDAMVQMTKLNYKFIYVLGRGGFGKVLSFSA